MTTLMTCVLALQPSDAKHWPVLERGAHVSMIVQVRQCPDASVNCTDSPECYESTSACRGTGNANASVLSLVARRLRSVREENGGISLTGCYHGLEGPYCLLCNQDNASMRVYFSAATSSSIAQCKPCSDALRNTIIISVFAALGVVVAALTLVYLYCRCVPTHLQRQLRAAWRRFTLHVKLKVIVPEA